MRPIPRPICVPPLVVLAACAAAGPLAAQGAAVPVGAARVAVDGSAYLAPGPYRTWSLGGAYLPFVSPRWQVGVAPNYGGVDGPDSPVYQNFQLAALANYLIPLGRGVRAYGGGYAARSSSTGAPRDYAVNTYGAQAGLLRFVAPAAALRAELRYRRSDVAEDPGLTQLLVVLDPYVGGAARGPRWTAPGLGAADLDVVAAAGFGPNRLYSLRAAAAPFLARWAQVGAEVQASHWAGYRGTPWALRGSGRLYAPLAGRTVPFGEGFARWSTYSDGRDGALSAYGAVAGVRRYAGPNAAFDLGVVREQEPAYEFPPGSVRRPTRTFVQLGVATHLRARRAR